MATARAADLRLLKRICEQRWPQDPASNVLGIWSLGFQWRRLQDGAAAVPLWGGSTLCMCCKCVLAISTDEDLDDMKLRNFWSKSWLESCSVEQHAKNES
ncbi:hypothetical protein EJB05_35219, partial [Eragrostis curvula]